ncbi:Hypothetical protein A7982_10900 [Minicystis rosea]|nr:Hypothetical protein A7982_10900 [Minicystis rosea]
MSRRFGSEVGVLDHVLNQDARSRIESLRDHRHDPVTCVRRSRGATLHARARRSKETKRFGLLRSEDRSASRRLD